MRPKFTETSTLVVSVLKWFALASVVGVLVGGSTALFLLCLQWTTGAVHAIPYHYALLPVALFTFFLRKHLLRGMTFGTIKQ